MIHLNLRLKKSSIMGKDFEKINRMRIVQIEKIRSENFEIKTFTFNDKMCGNAHPGQFIMVWIPGVDEIPISLSGIKNNGRTSITVHEVGEASLALNKKKKGEFIGIRGPFGNGFVPSKGNIMIVGGGTGIGPLIPLIEKVENNANRLVVMSGVKKKVNLLFLKTLEKISSRNNSEIVFSTEDGSYQNKGLITDQAEHILMNERFDMIYTCGPEIMMYKMFKLAEKNQVPIQASLERMMRCSIGICGSCQIGKFRVCKEGPVFSSQMLRSLGEEFGKIRLDSTGKKIKIE